jgi:hypothetical protein
MSKIRRQADRRKASKWELYVVRTGCRVEVVGNEQDKTTGRKAQSKQVGNVCRK